MKKAIVNSTLPHSIAEELEIAPGDEIISIDGMKPSDLLDYTYMTASEELALHIKRSSGEEEIIDIEKDAGEDLGIVFESAVFDGVIPCNNRCIFCFVDQQPPGLRKSLYIKDDDYRLSYLQGTYITLTNLTPKHRKRIEQLRPGPLYVSVHTTSPDLRQKMLNNPKAGAIMDELKWLDSLDIPLHTQIVVCPGINDGEELEKTLYNLSKHKNILSIAIVPVGVTKYRLDPPLIPPDRQQAREIIAIAGKYPAAYPSDELYITAGYDIPENSFYNGFHQLDDGVGAARTLLDDYKKRKEQLPNALIRHLNIAIAAGQLACKVMQPIVDDLNKIENLNVELVPVRSRFWGDDITVSGLITGVDLLDALMPLKHRAKNLVIPAVMLRKYTDRFLDNMTVAEISKNLDINVKIIENYYSTEELISYINEQNIPV